MYMWDTETHALGGGAYLELNLFSVTVRCFYPGSVRLFRGVRRVPGSSWWILRCSWTRWHVVLLHCRVSLQLDRPAKSPESSSNPEGIFRADWTYCPPSSADSDHLTLESHISNFRDALIDPAAILISRYSAMGDWLVKSKKACQKVQSKS